MSATVPAPTVAARVAVPAEDAVIRRVLRPVFRGWLRLQVEGVEHLPAAGGVLIASTHTSHADSIAIGTAAPRPIYFLGDHELQDRRVLGRWLPRFGMIPVRRGQGDHEAMEVVTDLLEADHAVAVFPEGSRSRDGSVHRPRSGVARISASTGVPVIPTAVVGSARVWPVDRSPRLLAGAVTVRFGAPMNASGTTPRARRAFATDLHDALVALSGAPRADGLAPLRGGETTE